MIFLFDMFSVGWPKTSRLNLNESDTSIFFFYIEFKRSDFLNIAFTVLGPQCICELVGLNYP